MSRRKGDEPRPLRPGVPGYEEAWLTDDDVHVDLGDPVRVVERHSQVHGGGLLPAFRGTFAGVKGNVVLVREDATQNLRSVPAQHVKPRKRKR